MQPQNHQISRNIAGCLGNDVFYCARRNDMFHTNIAVLVRYARKGGFTFVLAGRFFAQGETCNRADLPGPRMNQHNARAQLPRKRRSTFGCCR